MIRVILSELIERGLLTTEPPFPLQEIKQVLAAERISLPPAHLEFLALTDGATVCGGYFRIFGLNPTKPINLFAWNAPDLWKFAWGGKVDGYLCFGETAWGDQTAYRLEDLGTQTEPAVYMLDGHAMEPSFLFDTFQAYVENGFRQNAVHTYSEDVARARNELGDVTMEDHVVFVPSLLITGAAELCGIQKIEAVTAMILNGDLYQQLGKEPGARPVRELEPYTDEMGRPRLKVIWANS